MSHEVAVSESGPLAHHVAVELGGGGGRLQHPLYLSRDLDKRFCHQKRMEGPGMSFWSLQNHNDWVNLIF
jgi:hypothetical protein